MTDYAIKFVLVTIAVSLFDILYAQWNLALVARQPLKAAIFAAVTTLIGGFSVINYTEHNSLILAAILGSFIGTYIGTLISKKPTT